jgi:sulfide:quinone oxidoreductase
MTERPGLKVGLIEPSQTHYYQPLWTLVGGGVFTKEESARPQADVIPTGVTWIRDAVVSFEPEQNAVTTREEQRYTYDYLVVAPGLQLNWSAIKGLEGAMGKGGICSNYSYETVDSTWQALKNFKGGNAVFTFPSTPIKCAGAPQKIMWMVEHYLEQHNLRKNSNVIYASATAGIFGIPRYGQALQKLVDERDIKTHFRRNLVEVRPDKREAVFEDLDGGDPLTIQYDMLHVVPPQSAPDFVRRSPLANAEGWVDVHKFTTQHNRYPNVFGLGDASSLPTSRTGAAIRKEAPVTVANLLAAMDGKPLTAQYDGYASCPLVTGYGRLILAEFGYDGKVMETFPFDQTRERYSMYALKAYGLPQMYWHGMLQGRV